MDKVEVTEQYIRIPVNRRRKSDVIRTINIDKEQGIKAVYATNRKLVLTYIFLRSKWDLDEAKRWVDRHKNNNNSMEKQKEKHIKGYVEKVEKDGTLTAVIASDETKDRHGDVLKAEGWKLKNFKRNPVIQWAHDPTIPAVGKVEEIEVTKGKLMFKPKFAIKASKRAKEIYELYKEGILNAFSVGYRELERDAKGNTTEMELLEISAVNVPANPNALVLAKQKGLNADLIDSPEEDKSEEDEVKFYAKLDKRLENIESSIKDLADGFKHLEPKKKQGRNEQLKASVSEVLRTAQGVDKINESLIKKVKELLDE